MQVGQILIPHKISSIQLHVSISHLYTFYNTFFVQVFKSMNRGIAITVVKHQHQIHYQSEFPFAIINATEIIHRQNLLNLIEAIALQQPVKFGYFRPIYKLCEQLASVGHIFSEKPHNPFYLLISPIMKLDMYNRQNNMKKNFFESTHYIDHDHQKQTINQGYFKYQVNNLSKYLQQFKKANGINFSDEQMQQQQINKQFETLCIFCIYGLLRALKENCQILYQIVKEDQVIGLFQKVGLERMVKGHEKEAPGQVYLFTVKSEQEQKNKQINKNRTLEYYEKLALPIIGFGLFWKLYHFFTQ